MQNPEGFCYHFKARSIESSHSRFFVGGQRLFIAEKADKYERRAFFLYFYRSDLKGMLG